MKRFLLSAFISLVGFLIMIISLLMFQEGWDFGNLLFWVGLILAIPMFFETLYEWYKWNKKER